MFCVLEQVMPRKPDPQLGGQNAPISLMHLEHHHIQQTLLQQAKAFTHRFETPAHPQGWESLFAGRWLSLPV